MNPYQPPQPGGDAANPDLMTPRWVIAWLVVAMLSPCYGCGPFSPVPMVLAVLALLKRESDPKLARRLNRATIACVLAGPLTVLFFYGVWYALD
ncbi:MAG: hypothetical protein AB7K71_28590 [Polyangiaceae bacterium]